MLLRETANGFIVNSGDGPFAATAIIAVANWTAALKK
jgi:hypothetical protein